MAFARILIDSFLLLRICPRFFIPKILVAFFFFPIFILLPMYVLQVGLFSPGDLGEKSSIELMGILLQLVFLLIYTLAVYFIDSFLVNPMYPVLVQQFYKDKEINFRKAFIEVLHKFGTIFPSLLVFSLLLFAAMIPFMLIMMASLVLQSDFLFYVAIFTAFISIFLMLVLFYLLYPVSTLEKGNFVSALKHTIRTSLKHKVNVSKAVVVSIFITLLSYGLATAIVIINPAEQLMLTLAIFALLVATRFIVAIFSSYQYVLNAVLYMGLEKGIFLER